MISQYQEWTYMSSERRQTMTTAWMNTSDRLFEKWNVLKLNCLAFGFWSDAINWKVESSIHLQYMEASWYSTFAKRYETLHPKLHNHKNRFQMSDCFVELGTITYHSSFISHHPWLNNFPSPLKGFTPHGST